MPHHRPSASHVILALACGLAAPCAFAQSEDSAPSPASASSDGAPLEGAPSEGEGASIVTGEEGQGDAPATAPEAGVVVDDEPDTEGYGLLGPVRVGALVSGGVPQFLHYSLETRFWRVAGLSVGFGGLSTKAKDISIKQRNWDVRARWFPFEGSLFLGLALGGSKYDAKLERDLKVTFAGQSRTIPTTFKADVTRGELTPMLGWQWIFGPGFTLGFDLGWQIANSSKTNFSVEADGLTAQERALFEKQPEYKSNEKKVKEDFLDRYKDQGLPHIALGVGWMI